MLRSRLLRITKLLSKKKKYKKFQVFRFSNNDLNELSLKDTETLLGQKFKINLKNRLFPLVNVLKYSTTKDHPTELIIPQTSGYWNTVFGCHENISRAINIAKKIGLLETVSDFYHFGDEKPENNVAKIYVWNKKMEKVCLNLFHQYNINPIIENASKEFATAEKIIAKSKTRSMAAKISKLLKEGKVKISQKTSIKATDNEIKACITKLYPMYVDTLKLIQEDNLKNLNNPDEWDYFPINIHRSRKSKLVTKISARKSNKYCNSKVHNITEEDKQTNRVLRHDLLMKKFGAYNENDVSSSIYRVTYLLNYGEWLDRDVDLYESIAGFKFESKEARKYFKQFCMRLYFSKSAKQVIKDIKRSIKKGEVNMVLDKDTIRKIKGVYQRMREVIGESYYSEIFMHESCIYTLVAHRLREMGYRLIQIYDGFYTDKHLDEKEFDRIVKDCALEYMDKYGLYKNLEKYEQKYEIKNQNIVLKQIIDLKNVKNYETVKESNSVLKLASILNLKYPVLTQEKNIDRVIIEKEIKESVKYGLIKTKVYSFRFPDYDLFKNDKEVMALYGETNMENSKLNRFEDNGDFIPDIIVKPKMEKLEPLKEPVKVDYKLLWETDADFYERMKKEANGYKPAVCTDPELQKMFWESRVEEVKKQQEEKEKQRIKDIEKSHFDMALNLRQLMMDIWSEIYYFYKKSPLSKCCLYDNMANIITNRSIWDGKYFAEAYKFAYAKGYMFGFREQVRLKFKDFVSVDHIDIPSDENLFMVIDENGVKYVG